MNKKNKIILNFLIINGFILSFFLRFYQFGEIPPGLNRDEASIGYTAYSLLKTGRDEYGHFLPLSIKSFGDWKLPGYVYATVPFVGVFGLHDWVIRFPSALAGIATIIAVYFLAEGLLKGNQGERGDRGKILPLIAALLLALTPWHIHFSRAGYEANLGLLFFTLGNLFFLKSKFIFSALCFALTLYSYHTYHLLTPLFLVALLILKRRKFREEKKSWLLGGGLFLALSGLIFWQNLSGNLTKSSGISFMTDPVIIHSQIDLPRSSIKNFFLGKLVYNKITVFSKIFLVNYLASFSPSFLVFKGGSHPVHNTPGIGQFLLIQYLFFLIGLYWLLREKKRDLILPTWLLLAPLASSITKDAPNSVRLTPLIIPLVLTAAWGAINLMNKLKNKGAGVNLLILVAVGATFFNVFLFGQRYFSDLPRLRAENWGGGYEELVAFLNSEENKNKTVIIDRPNYSPYIYFLFYENYDPERFQQEVERYSPTSDGFFHVKSFGRFQFRDFELEEALEEAAIIVKRATGRDEEEQDQFSTFLKKTIKDEFQQLPLFYVFEKNS